MLSMFYGQRGYSGRGGPQFDLMGNPVAGYQGSIGGLPGMPPTGYNSAFGGIPQTPDPAHSQHQAVAGDLNNWSEIERLTQLINDMNRQNAQQTNAMNLWQSNQINQQNRGQAEWETQHNAQIAALNAQHAQSVAAQNTQRNIAQKQLEDMMNQQAIRNQMEAYTPGLSGLLGQRSQNLASQLGGQVSDSTWNQLAIRAAERGQATGQGVDSPGANAALMAALGLTSEGLQQQGMQNLAGSMSGTPLATPVNAPFSQIGDTNVPYSNVPFSSPPFANIQNFDPSGMLVNPAQQYEAQMMANWLAAAPNPAAAASQNMASLYGGLNAGRQGSNQGGYMPYSPTGAPSYGQPQFGASPYYQSQNVSRGTLGMGSVGTPNANFDPFRGMTDDEYNQMMSDYWDQPYNDPYED